MNKLRTEKDSLGSLKIPADAYFGIHTWRSHLNFPISPVSGLQWHPLLIAAIARLKKACALANMELKLLESKKGMAILKACDDVINEKIPSDQFPLDIYQSGSGTSTNMNVNEVIANRACELLKGKKGDRSLVHPNDDVNKGQSTNDVIPSAIRMSCLSKATDLESALKNIQQSLSKKASEFKNIKKAARTHLQDAVPITLGQEFQAYATAVSKHSDRLKAAKKYLKVLGIGGNAVGTGINTPKIFRSLIIRHLNAQKAGRFSVPKDGIESTQFLTDIAALSAVLKLLAIDLNKICNDLRLLSSGPNTGFNEITLPAVEPGSSIMPGKINPSVCEALNMVCHRVIGNDTTITLACASGNLDLNTHMPLIGNVILESLDILINGINILSDKCITGIKANKDRCQWYLENSAARFTELVPKLGYDKVARMVKESLG